MKYNTILQNYNIIHENISIFVKGLYMLCQTALCLINDDGSVLSCFSQKRF